MQDWIRMLREELKPESENGPNGSPIIVDLGSGAEGFETESSLDEEDDWGDESGGDEEQAKTEDESDDEEEHREPTEVGSHLQIGRISTERDRRNIPEMAVIVLISCHKEILTTEEIPSQFMAYITNNIFRCLLDLREYGKGSLLWEYNELMLHCLNENLTGRRADPLYRENLKRVYYGNYGDPNENSVRTEVVVKDRQMTDLVDDLDEIIEE